MANLTTKYLGLTLDNPIIAGSSGLSGNIDGVKKLAQNNVGAIVLKSLFEEQIKHEIVSNINKDQSAFLYPEASDYIHNYTKANSIGIYLKLIEESKKAVKVPIIASINCISSTEWTAFAKDIQNAGADAIELNVFMLPSDVDKTGSENEQVYFDIIEKVRSLIKIPIALKMGQYSAGLGNLIQKISWSGNVDGIVLFNRSYTPDIDINELKITSTNVFSTP
jgi:dihydroorotate dehydrogenase (fumarate)